MTRVAAVELDVLLAELLSRRPGRAGADGTAAGGTAAGGTAADTTTEALLGAASALLGEQGTRNWTMEEVAERAGVGRATVYRRFASREELVRAAVGRDAGRFFAAVADSVRTVEPLEEKVVSGFLSGLRLAQATPLSSLLLNDPVAAVSLLTSESLLRAATAALTDRYEALLGTALDGPSRARAAVAAEALIRLALSFVLIPGPAADLADGPGDDRPARDHLAGIIRPLVAVRNSPRR